MRLTPEEIAAIKAAAAEAFGPDAVVRLFGSRVDDARRGGDIDLLVEVGALADEWHQKATFEDRFHATTEPRKVDLLVAVRGQPVEPFQQIAYRDGVLL